MEKQKQKEEEKEEEKQKSAENLRRVKSPKSVGSPKT